MKTAAAPREAMALLSAAVVLLAVSCLIYAPSVSGAARKLQQATQPLFVLPPLPYAYEALEPIIDNTTQHFHHDTHHKAYVDNLNKVVVARPQMRAYTLTELVQAVGRGKLNETIRTTVRNNAGGAWNHAMWWRVLAAPGSDSANRTAVSPALQAAITSAFGSFDNMVAALSTSAKTHFGSGWAWLCLKGKGASVSLKTMDTLNQDNPLMEDIEGAPCTPILGLDVWEHAYYLKYGPKKASFVDAWFQVINWAQVSANYDAAVRGDIAAIIGDADARHAQ